MRKLIACLAVVVTTTVLAAGSGLATTGSPAKVWLCHKTKATFETDAGTFAKFVPIRVSGRAEVRAHVAHGDVRVLPAPTGTWKANLKASRQFCAALRIAAPVTPTTGGVRLDAVLSGGGVTANLTVRTQVGQQRLCYLLQVNAPAGATVQLTSLTLTHASTTVTIDSAQLASTSGCVMLASKAVARVLLSGDVTATLSGTLTPTGGSPTAFSAVGTLSA